MAMARRDLERSMRIRSTLLWYASGVVAIVVVLALVLPRL